MINYTYFNIQYSISLCTCGLGIIPAFCFFFYSRLIVSYRTILYMCMSIAQRWTGQDGGCLGLAFLANFKACSVVDLANRVLTGATYSWVSRWCMEILQVH